MSRQKRDAIRARRYHDISVGHKVTGHASKCAHLHGHNYRVHFEVQATTGRPSLDKIGVVLDFSCIKETLCEWLEHNWDHRFLIYKDDPWAATLFDLDKDVLLVDFNPTAENMAAYLLRTVGPQLLPESVELVRVVIEETAKCSVSMELKNND